MSILANPVVLCASIALGIILLLIIVVVICCKRGTLSEREELMAMSDEIESNSFSEIETSDDRIEDVLTKMQESLETKESVVSNFEDQQEENAIISYQELLTSLGAKSNIDVDNIELYEDELEGQIEISDVNKEIIDAYQKENLDREIYRFQNDYSNEGLSTEVVQDVPSFYDFSKNISYVDEENVSELSNEELVYNFSDSNVEPKEDVVYDFSEEKVITSSVDEYDFSENDVTSSVEEYNFSDMSEYEPVHTAKAISASNKADSYKNTNFRKSEFISPVYGIVNQKNVVNEKFVDEPEEIIFEDDSLLDEF